MNSFATDSFGPMQWVDDEKCTLFVKNLLTVLHPEPTNATLNNDYVSIVNTFSDGYKYLPAPNSLHQDGIKLSFNFELDERCPGYENC